MISLLIAVHLPVLMIASIILFGCSGRTMSKISSGASCAAFSRLFTKPADRWEYFQVWHGALPAGSCHPSPGD